MPSRLPVLLTLLAVPVSHAIAQDGVDSVFAEWNSPSTPGCIVEAAKNGKSLFARAYGMADLERNVPNTVSTISETGSIAKQFTAAAILMLAADGKLALTDDVRRYVPELPQYEQPVTIDALLTHRSGLREWSAVAALGGREVVTYAQFLETMARVRTLNFRPGEQFSYASGGFVIASLIVSRVSGKSFADFTRDRIFTPLGMTHTSWRVYGATTPVNTALAYRKTTAGYSTYMPNEEIIGHGGIRTTVGDLLRWNDAIANGRLGKRLSAELLHEARLNDGTPTGYGRGVFLDRYNGYAEYYHDGGHLGYRAWLGWYPDAHVSVALLCNTLVPDVTALAHRVVDVVLPPASSATVVQQAPKAAAIDSMRPEEAARYAGTFLSDELGLPLYVTSEGGKLNVEGSIAEIVAPGHFRTSWAELIYQSPDVMRLVKRGPDRQTLRRVDARIPTATELESLAGRYRSNEADASFIARVESGALVLRLESNPDVVRRLVPLGWDTFRVGSTIVRFTRDANGKPASLSFSMSRLHDLRFVRDAN